ncbi:MAG: YicC/YloC family endoribonuclease [Gammaproteobacteria bacterium]
MIQSMTAFARAQGQGKWGSAVCEVRSINHRYLEMSIRLPDTLHEFESPIRERIRHHIKRGKIELNVRYQPGDVTGTEITINTHLAEKLCRANETIANMLKNPASIDPMSILQWPGLLQIAELDLETIEDEILNLLEKALLDLLAARAREGEELKQLFLQRLESMKTELAKVRQRLPAILTAQRERLAKRFTDAKLEMETGRLEQEIVMFAQRIDVTEELDRLDAHISEVRRVLKQGGVVGRRLDFLMQELNREANTLGAKSVDVDTTRASVELKVLIEQIREQVQNVE